VRQASTDNQIRLKLIGIIPAGGDWSGEIASGEVVRILSGARIPEGVDAVLAEEFTREDDGMIEAFADADPGRNILKARNDIYIGKPLVEQGEKLTPMKIGLLASAGYVELPVCRRPKVAIIATGDEVVAPGTPLQDGKLYASNLVTLAVWCVHFGFQPETWVVPDDEEEIRNCLIKALDDFDVILTSGGAWKGDRDLVAKIMDSLGWDKIYHRIKMAPGKAVGFGLYKGTPVFILPGGPPSNHMAFLQLALPALQKMAGWRDLGFPVVPARLAESIRRQTDWPRFVHGRLEKDTSGELVFSPSKQASRLQMIAASDAILMIPEDCDGFQAGADIKVQQLVNNLI